MQKAEIRNQLLLQKGEELYVRFARTSISTELAIKANNKEERMWDQIIPNAYHKFKKVFDKEASY